MIRLNDPTLKEQFWMAEPYPHLVIDDVWESEFCESVIERTQRIEKWVDTNKSFVERRNSEVKDDAYKFENYKKDFRPIANRPVADYSEITGPLQEAVARFQSDEWLAFMSDLLGVPVFCDRDNLRGGGLQRAYDGAYLKVHLDNNWNEKVGAWTVANCIYFLTPEWSEDFGGSLELWTEFECVKKIQPVKNRMVISINNERSYHGYPDPIQAPSGKFRQALVLFYYSHQMLVESDKRPSALWRE